MQEKFYHDVICNPNSHHRYWGVWLEPYEEDTCFIGLGGITNIQWENRIGEISLILNPEERGKGYGEQVVDLLLDKAFNYLNLQTVCGEVYWSNPEGVAFWQKIVGKFRQTHLLELPNRKYWKGQFYPSWYFSIDRGDYVK